MLYHGLMSLRTRKLIGAMALIILVLAWALIAMAVAQFPAVKANKFLESVYYVVIGLGWVLPAMPLVRWMLGAGRPARRSAPDQ